MKKLLATILALVMALSLCSVSWADGTGNIVVHGIKYNGKDDSEFATFEAAYAALKPVVASVCDTSGGTDGLGQESAKSAEAFKSVFTDVDSKGNATITYKISGNVTYDETSCANLLTMGRKSSHYNADNQRLHLINFKFIGEDANRDATLTVNSNITLPYEWWGEKVTTSISFENLTITGSAPNGLYPYQKFFEGISFSVNNCTLKGIKIYNCSNVGGSYSITNSTLDGTGAPGNAYAIHLQGNETAPLTITISGNEISGYDRGVNIDQKTAQATVSENKISIKDAGRSCIQLTQLKTTTVSGNTMNLTGGNAITLHENLLNLAAAPKITISGNDITGNGYLIYEAAKADSADKLVLNMSGNTISDTVDTTKGIKGTTVSDNSTIVNDAVREGVSVKPVEQLKYYYKSPTTTDNTTKGSPKTFDAGVGIYAVTAVLSVTGMAWTAKKRH